MIRRNVFAAHWVLWTCLFMAGVGFVFLRWNIQREAQRGFQEAVRQMQAQIDFRLERYEDVLLQTRAHFQNVDRVTRSQFRDYNTDLAIPSRFPGLSGLGYSKRLTPAELDFHERAVRSTGFPSYRVWPEGPRDEYFTILFLEPFDWRNQRAFGFDMSTETAQREAMERSRDSGEPVSSRRVTLVQETEKDPQAGFLMYVPVYRTSVIPASLDERRASLTGFVFSPFRAADLFSVALQGYDPERFDIEVYSAASPSESQLLFDLNPNYSLAKDRGLEQDGGRFRTTIPLTVPGDRWSITIAATQAYIPLFSRILPFLAALVGLFIAFLLFRIVRNQEAYSRKEAEARRTLELVNEVGRKISGELKLDRLVQELTDVGTQLTKGEFGAFFYAVEDDRGDQTVVYAFSGMTRDQLESFPLARLSGMVVRSKDVRRDPRFGASFTRASEERSGELAVSSFLSVPVVSRSGESIGGLFFGHSVAGVFTAREEQIAMGLAAQAAVAIDNARLYQRAQDAITARDEFLSICSHELKTPLTSLKLQTQMYRRKLKSGDPTAFGPERMEKLTQTSERQIERLSRLVEDMLDIARISSGRLTIRPERVELYGLVAEMIERVAPHGGEVQAPIHLTGPATTIEGNWDRLRLEQVVLNLLSNSVKYGDQKPVHVVLEKLGEEAIITILDQGIGIDKPHQKRIFERFERAISATNISGLGLGLYIVRQILEAHDGAIFVESDLGKGAKFIVRLPLNPRFAQRAPISIASDAPPAEGPSSGVWT